MSTIWSVTRLVFSTVVLLISLVTAYLLVEAGLNDSAWPENIFLIFFGCMLAYLTGKYWAEVAGKD